MRRKIIALLFCATPLGLVAQNNYFGEYRRPVSEVFKTVEQRFGIKIKCNVDTVGKSVAYADFRVKPYSLEETLDNICKEIGANWFDEGKGKYKIRPYEYARRHPSDGQKMLSWLQGQYSNAAEWEKRKDTLRSEIRQRLEIDRYLDSCVKGREAVLSKIRKYDGYTVQNICIETLPGEFLYGSIYSPRKKGRHALIICPNGHFYNGRYRKDQQQRLASLARMGAICVSYDIYGWGESKREHPEHRTDRAHVIQALDGLKLLDWMLTNRAESIDTLRIAANGGSGGGSLTVLLSALDKRFTAAAPVVSLASHFDGGCPCESGKPIHLAAGGTCNPEILAMMAPQPVLVVSDGGDWTHTVPTLEMPYLERIWGFYGVEKNIRNVHLPAERHDFGPNKRDAVYRFFIDVFRLDASMLNEESVVIEPIEAMMSFPDKVIPQ